MADTPPIGLQVQVPAHASPIQSIAGLMQLRSSLTENALRQAQIQQTQQNTADIAQQTQLRQQEVADQNTLQEAMGDPAKARLLASGDYSPLNGKVRGTFLNTLESSRLANIEKKATTDEKTLNLHDKLHEELGKTLDGILTTAGDDRQKIEELWSGARSHLIELGYRPETLPQSLGGKEGATQLAATNSAFQAMNQAAIGRKKELQQIGTAEAQQTEATAKAAEATATAALTNMKIGLMKGLGQASIDSAADSLAPPAQFPEANNAMKQAGRLALASGDPSKVESAMMEVHRNQVVPNLASTRAGEVAKQGALLPGEVAKAVAVEKATTPLKVGQAIATAKALRMGDNPAVSGVAPAAVAQVQNSAIKLDQDYIAARTASDDIAQVLDLAESGNKAAGANVPLMGVGAINAVNGIKRINSAEIRQYGTAGSLIDRIQGKLEGWTEGKPIPNDVLEDMRTVHEMLSAGAYKKYTADLSALNLRTGAKYEPAVSAPRARVAAGKIRARDAAGNLHEAPAGTALPAGWTLER